MELVTIFVIALRAVISVMEAILILRVFCEFRAIHRESRPFQFLLSVSEPLLEPVRKILLKQAKEKKLKFDTSPFVVLILLFIISKLLKNYLP